MLAKPPVPTLTSEPGYAAGHSPDVDMFVYTSSSALDGHDDAGSAVDATLHYQRPGVSSGSSSSLEQSTTCDESRQLTAAV